jgi:uncharacterized membrane protein
VLAFTIASLKVMHVFTGIWFVAGVIGRGLTQVRAERTSDVAVVKGLVELIGRFDSLMVIPGSMAVLVLGALAAWIEGAPLFGFIQGANANWLLVSSVLFVTILALVPTVFIPRGRGFGAALDEAVAAGRVTDRLSAAFRDPVVRAAHIWELIALAAIVWLMISKPF